VDAFRKAHPLCSVSGVAAGATNTGFLTRKEFLAQLVESGQLTAEAGLRLKPKS
jgi:hypothetical protein